MGTVRTYCPTMRGLLVLACFAFFAVANGHQKLVKSEQCEGTMCPAGHMVPSHCFLAAILTSFSFMLTNGQSAAVAAQYMLSGQQNQFCSGQQPAGHIVPSHCFLAAILTSFSFMLTNGQSAAVAAQYMLSGQQNQFCSGQQPA